MFYVWFCYSHIEPATIQIDMKTFQSGDLKRYAKRRFFLTFMARPWLLRRAVRQFHNLPAETNEDVDKIVREILTYERQVENPSEVDPKIGWSPYLASKFLSELELKTGDYHSDGFDDQWWAISD